MVLEVFSGQMTGTRSTFEFPSRFNLSSLYCIARTLGIKQTLSRTSRCNKVDAVRLSVKFTFTKGSEVREMYQLALLTAQLQCFRFTGLYIYKVITSGLTAGFLIHSLNLFLQGFNISSNDVSKYTVGLRTVGL